MKLKLCFVMIIIISIYLLVFGINNTQSDDPRSVVQKYFELSETGKYEEITNLTTSSPDEYFTAMAKSAELYERSKGEKTNQAIVEEKTEENSKGDLVFPAKQKKEPSTLITKGYSQEFNRDRIFISEASKTSAGGKSSAVKISAVKNSGKRKNSEAGKSKISNQSKESKQSKESNELKELISSTVKLWRKYHLSYDQANYVGKEIRKRLGIKRAKTRKNVIERLSKSEEQKLIKQAYREKSSHGLLLKTLFLTGARVSEFVSLKASDFYFDEQMILIRKGKGGKSRYVPVLAELAQELKTHLGERTEGYIFESNRHTKFTTRRIQQIVKETADRAGITKKVHPHLLRHTVATYLTGKRNAARTDPEIPRSLEDRNDTDLCRIFDRDDEGRFSESLRRIISFIELIPNNLYKF